MGFVNASTCCNDGYSSGILGLAYPIIDDIHPSGYKANTTVEFLENRVAYPTVMKRLQELEVTYFSMALDRVPLNQEIGFGGYLAFGELPPVDHDSFVTVPVEILRDAPLLVTNGTKQISYWTLSVSGVTWDKQVNSEQWQAVVDSGNWLNYLPAAIAAKVNAAFNPPAKFDSSSGVYIVDCNATPPPGVGIQIGGQMFAIDSADMIYRESEGVCISSVAAASSYLGFTIAILGDAFLRNVVAVFDYGKDEMRFAQRISNSSSSGSTPTSGSTSVFPHARFLASALIASVTLGSLF